MEALTSLHSFYQLMSEPTHPLPHSNSCNDLILTDQLNLAVNCGTCFSLNSKRHNQITYRKLNFNIECLHMNGQLGITKKAHTDNIKKSIDSIDWELL